ncbi:CFEM domain-containing protein [Colletotrichum tofieldiae]|uniref:CFEM domain-containing protein n=1 Tax=Colletotrichum tofieldiae TaxID=708197 RepID=A0A161WBK7_9PEZI|nr:CFEM domain-containing protein [Colletotrichum tofieldiae]GKT57214.1 CFEM domain-containing protein [Colletotrichum tofieldiae]GKT78945.1 CFEM domain-containing protein [Colletotrichum tofieldiae]GKT86765.1 CFEM domain-containing protein [Colletotrichum tofieldiae]
MKSVIYLGVGLLSGAMAQNNLAGCGNGCIQSMQGLASDLGCTAGDTACLCRNPNFTYGIRDCSFQSCQQSGDAQQAVAAGVELCRQAGVAVEVTPVVTVSQLTGTATVTPSVSGGSAVATPSPVTTSSFTTVITSGGSTITSVGETTIFGVGGVPGASSVPASAVTTAPIVSTITSGGSVITSTIGSTTILSSLTGSDASSALSSQASDASEASTATATETQSETATETQSESATQTQTGAATSASESGNAAKQTAVPVAGFLAAAGFAVMLI